MTTDVRFNAYRSQIKNNGRIYMLSIYAYQFCKTGKYHSVAFLIKKMAEERGRLAISPDLPRIWWSLSVNYNPGTNPAFIYKGSLSDCYRKTRDMIGPVRLMINCDREEARDPDYQTA